LIPSFSHTKQQYNTAPIFFFPIPPHRSAGVCDVSQLEEVMALDCDAPLLSSASGHIASE
jgi:hypothetical protein